MGITAAAGIAVLIFKYINADFRASIADPLFWGDMLLFDIFRTLGEKLNSGKISALSFVSAALFALCFVFSLIQI